MSPDERVTQLLVSHARSATQDVVAPASWPSTVPARARARRRRTRATTALGALAAAGVAASIVVPLARTDPGGTGPTRPSTQLVAYDFRLAGRAGHPVGQLPCLTGTPPRLGGSTSALSVAVTRGDQASCVLVQGRRDASLPTGARRVPGHGGHLYLGPTAAGYRLGYRTYEDPAGGSPLVLQLAVAPTVPAPRLIGILDTTELVPRG